MLDQRNYSYGTNWYKVGFCLWAAVSYKKIWCFVFTLYINIVHVYGLLNILVPKHATYVINVMISKSYAKWSDIRLHSLIQPFSKKAGQLASFRLFSSLYCSFQRLKNLKHDVLRIWNVLIKKRLNAASENGKQWQWCSKKYSYYLCRTRITKKYTKIIQVNYRKNNAITKLICNKWYQNNYRIYQKFYHTKSYSH